MAEGKSRCFRASYRRPLPIMSALRAPESWPSTLRHEISQGIAWRRGGNLRVDQKEKSARLAKRRASIDDHAARRLKQQRSKSAEQGIGREPRGLGTLSDQEQAVAGLRQAAVVKIGDHGDVSEVHITMAEPMGIGGKTVAVPMARCITLRGAVVVEMPLTEVARLPAVDDMSSRRRN